MHPHVLQFVYLIVGHTFLGGVLTKDRGLNIRISRQE
jgi:hypothetical protein